MKFQENIIKSHAYFNMGYMHYIGNGTSQNTTKFYEYLNNTIKYEPNLYIPVSIFRSLVWLEGISQQELSNIIFNYLVSSFNNGLLVVGSSCFVVFYVIFYIMLKFQS
jgi:hypothetical protein